jgi:adenylyltransferase/sulfurtransferase
VALYLAAAGVGTLGLADADRVDLSNLHRQVLYATTDIGTPKVEAAVQKLKGLNDQIRIVPHLCRVGPDSVMDLVGSYDLVVDGTDNQATRYLLNDATSILGRPFVAGAVHRFEGMVGVFNLPAAAPGTADGPCYRCLFPDPTPAGLVPNCAEAGVLGALPGVIGTMQAVEALKLILGIGQPLAGRFLSFDALAGQWHMFRISPAPECPLCRLPRTKRHLIPFPADQNISPFCSLKETDARNVGTEEVVPLSPTEVFMARASGALLIDIREEEEWRSGTIAGSRHLPLAVLESRRDELPTEQELILFCQIGRRSERGVRLLKRLGFPRVRHLGGGLMAWPEALEKPAFSS